MRTAPAESPSPGASRSRPGTTGAADPAPWRPRGVAAARLLVSLPLLALLATACDGSGVNAAAETDHAHGPHRGPALPYFSGTLVDGSGASTDLLQGRRALLFVFSPYASGADSIARLVASVRADAEAANVLLVGVQQGPDPEQGRSFSARHALDFPTFADSNGAIGRKLPIETGKAALLVVDAEGFVVFGFSGLDDEAGPELYEDALRDALHLRAPAAAEPAFGVRPLAPAFEVESLDGETLRSADLEGRVRVVAFFLHTCPHCHEALQFLRRIERRLASPELVVVAISVQNNAGLVRDMAKRLGIDGPLYLDADGTAQDAYGHGASVPDTFVIARDGRVDARHEGMSARIEALLSMEIRQALGVANPLLLDRSGFSGGEACLICHREQHATWTLTSHAYAFDTLLAHGEERNPECLPCHTVGWGERGGYSLDHPERRLQGVQCENCHGRGGPHQSPDFASAGLAPVCEGCHNKTHSLRFDFADRLPLVSHAANRVFDGLSVEERRALIERRDRRERQLFDKAHFVGSAACGSCHESESQRWAQQAHAHAFDTLEAKGEAQNPECQRCHTTGFQEEGGFPSDTLDHAHVGCESCHGPGGNHVAPDAPKSGTILALTDKCDSCVILQICGSCHDEANDPRFEFELAEKLDRIRHGFRDREAPAQAAAE